MTATENTNINTDLRLDNHPDLKLSLEETGIRGSVVIRLSGMIDTYNSDFFRLQAGRVVEAGFRNIIIDASSTTFMSSTGIGAFTSILKLVRKNEGSMIIFGMPTKIFEVFQLLGFSSFFQFCSTREDALGLVGVHRTLVPLFPVTVSCPVCNSRLKAVKSGRFRCSSCRVILGVNQNGEVSLA